MSSIDLNTTQRNRLSELGLVQRQSTGSGYDRYLDPQTGAIYTLSPSGYVLRKSKAGTYQVNPRFLVKGNKSGRKQVQATVRFTDAGAVTELAVQAVTNYRKHRAH